jgi:hypothetical protein
MNSASSLAVRRMTWPVVAPQLRERAFLKPLLKNAQPGSVPQQHLAELSALVHEQEQLAAERIAFESGLHQTVEAVVSLPEIDRSRVREYAYHATRPEDHAMPRRISIAASIETPSIRSPFGGTRVNVPTGGASITLTTFISDEAELASVHRTRVCVGSPIASEISVHHSPRSRRTITHAVIRARSVGG